MSASPNNAKWRSEEPPSFVAVVLVLVVVHFLFMLAVPIAFVYEVKLFLFRDGFYIWLCQPLFVAAFLTAINRRCKTCGILVYIDVSTSILQIASVFLLYALADKIG